MSAAMKLELFHEGQLLQEIPFAKNEVWVGRDQGCVVRLEDRAISRRHAVLKNTDRGIEFEKKSKFGWVKVNGIEVTQTLLKEGDRVEMGPYEIRVSGPDAPAGATIAETPQLIQQMIQPELPSLVMAEEPAPGVEALPEIEAAEPVIEESLSVETPQPEFTQSRDVTHVIQNMDPVKAILQFNEGEANVSQYDLSDEEVAIGRAEQCHIVLEDKKSSRKHAIIRREGTKYFLKDLGSANGTLVNGARVDDIELQSGDQIQIGETAFAFKIVQTNYEAKKAGFISVPQQEIPSMDGMISPAPGVEMLQPLPMGDPAEAPAPDFAAPQATKKSFIGQFIDRYRAMNTKQQIIWGVAILALVYFMLDDDTPPERAKLNTGTQQKVVPKKGEKKPGDGQSFDSLTPDQQRYVETQYQLAFDLYKNREYDKALLEVGKIFSLVQDYKNAREIEAFAREGKRKLEAQEEERKRKEAERQNQLKLQSLLEQAGMLMDKKRFREAEALFPEIELIQPENAAVNEWRKTIMSDGERVERERQEQERLAELQKKGWGKLKQAIQYKTDHDYQTALDMIAELKTMTLVDKKLIHAIQDEEHAVRQSIASERDPLLAEGKEQEQNAHLASAYKAYEKAHDIDPEDTISTTAMARIHGTLTARAKAMYIEAVFAESYNDLDSAERNYREIMNVVPKDDEYYVKAESRLKRVTAYRKPAAEAAP